MDKKNTTIGVLLLLLAFAALKFLPSSPPPTKPENAQPATSAATPAGTAKDPARSAAATTTTPAAAPVTNTGFAPIAVTSKDATVTTLTNDFIEARFTDFGGAIEEVAFKKYAAVEGKPEPYIFNHVHEDPLLAFSDDAPFGRGARYELVRKTDTEVVYRAVINNLEVTRTYRVNGPGQPGDPYRIHHETTFVNRADTATPAPRTLSLGTATLLNAFDTGQYLAVATFDGSDPHYVTRSNLEGGNGFFGVGASATKPVLETPATIAWGAVKNQFFTSIYTPDKPGTAIITKRIELKPFENSPRPNIGLTAATRFEVPPVAAKGTTKLAGDLYVGPQEYKRLAAFDHNEARVLPYTQYFFNKIFFSRFVAPFLNLLMTTMHSWVGNWGVAVILMTLTLKIVSLPFTLAASRSAKRMAKIQPELAALREKYKDNPQKQQAATIEIFKQHKVNPVGGCVPVLITMPLFIGFYAMLQCTAELRFQPFLWSHDLSAPDTIAVLGGIPINLMPLLMGSTMFFQMRLTPTPSVDNMQVKMMQFMPIVFTFICYNFSCALSLYSTINGLFTIGQQLVINKMKDPADRGPAGPGTAAAATASAFGKGMKNVTPSKNKKLK